MWRLLRKVLLGRHHRKAKDRQIAFDGGMRRAFSVAWKSVALVVAGIVVAFVLIVVITILFGGGIGDPVRLTADFPAVE